MPSPLRIAIMLILFALVSFSGAARAQVTATYYSMDFGENFPHAFVHLTGTSGDGTVVNQYLGFSAKTISPAILMSSVRGEVLRRTPKFLKVSEPRFSLELTDAQYESILAIADVWEARGGLKYNLNKRNCVHFVADTIVSIGLNVNWDSTNWKKPKGFLRETARLNAATVFDFDNPVAAIASATDSSE